MNWFPRAEALGADLLDRLALLAKLLKKVFNRHRELAAEQVDECVFVAGDLGC